MSKDPWRLLTSRTLNAGLNLWQAGAQYHVRVPTLKGDEQQAGIFTGRVEQQRCLKVILEGQFLQTEPPMSFLRTWLWMLRKQGGQVSALPTSPLPQWSATLCCCFSIFQKPVRNLQFLIKTSLSFSSSLWVFFSFLLFFFFNIKREADKHDLN